jgi:hypothetical protein
MNQGLYPPLVLAMLAIIAGTLMDGAPAKILMLLNASAWVAISALSIKGQK